MRKTRTNGDHFYRILHRVLKEIAKSKADDINFKIGKSTRHLLYKSKVHDCFPSSGHKSWKWQQNSKNNG